MPTREPAYGQRLLTHLIDERAATQHQRPYALVPHSSNPRDGFKNISYKRFADAINCGAVWLQKNFSHLAGSNIVMYIGPSDLRYQILALAAVKSGHVMFFPSPRNTPDSLQKLVQDATCTKCILTDPPSPLMRKLLQRNSSTELDHVVIPALDFFLDETTCPHIPLKSSFHDMRHQVWIIIHTSGSTGNSKLVRLRHGFATCVDAFRLFEQNDMMRLAESRYISTFPPFHVAGIIYSLNVACFYDSTIILPPPEVPLTADLIHAMHRETPVDHYLIAPSIASDLAKNETFLDYLTLLQGLTFAGGPLPVDTAAKISEKTKLTSGYGATEYGSLPTIPRDAEDWQYLYFNQQQGGIEMRPVQDEDRYELVLVRRPSAHLAQAIFVNFPHLQEYHTKDLFSSHPTKHGLYKYEARLDDILVLANGENLNPVAMEGIFMSSPQVNGCLIVGQGRMQTGLLVEPTNDSISRADLIRALTPLVERANTVCPSYGKLGTSFISRLPPGQRFPRAAKGTIQRAKSIHEFQSLIEGLYSNPTQGFALDMTDAETLCGSLKNYLAADLQVPDMSQKADFFDAGMDSLSVINLTRVINLARGKKNLNRIETSLIYENPTLTKLTSALQQSCPESECSDSDAEDRIAWQAMEKQYNYLTRNQPGFVEPKRNIFRSDNPAPLYQRDGGIEAWAQVVGAFLVNMNNWGLVNSFGVYLSFYEDELLPTHSRSEIAWIGTVQAALLLLVGVVSGPLSDLGFFRAILLVTGFTVVLSQMLLSLATKYYQIMLCQGILLGVCLGFLYIPSVALIPLYFKKHRGLALGLATGGGSFGGIIYPLILRRLIRLTGFGWANRIVGFVCLLSLILADVCIKPIGRRPVRNLFDVSALTELSYVCFLLSAFLLFAGVLVPFVVLPLFAQAAPLSLSQGTAISFVPILNVAQLIGRVAFGALSDEIGPEIMLLLAQFCSGVLAFCWIAVGTESGLISWSVVYGLLSGAVVSLPAAVLPYISPSLAVIGTRLGMLYGVAGLGLLLSAPVALAIGQRTTGFWGTQIWVGACCITGVCFYGITCIEAWKRRRLYNMRNKSLSFRRRSTR